MVTFVNDGKTKGFKDGNGVVAHGQGLQHADYNIGVGVDSIALNASDCSRGEELLNPLGPLVSKKGFMDDDKCFFL